MDNSSPKGHGQKRSREMDLKTEDAYEEEQRPRRSVGRPRSVSNIKKVGGKKRKFLRKAPGIKRRRVSGHVIGYEEPLRRSKREKRLVFATLNVSQMDKQILNPGPSYQELDLSEEEMDPYEKLLSPCRNTRRSARLSQAKSVEKESEAEQESGDKTAEKKDTKVKEENKEGDAKGEGEEETEDQSEEEEEEEEEEEGEEEEEEEEEEEGEEGGYYNLRKRQPVIYHFQPVHEVVQRQSPPAKRRLKRMTRHTSYHSKGSSGPVAYQIGQSRHRPANSSRRREAHHDSSTTSSDTDSDEGRFRRRKNRSMAKSRVQCMPMNFNNEDMAQGVIRDRMRIGASLADINPMNIDQSITFDSIGGLKGHIRALKEMIIFPFLYPEVFERFQISPPRGVLFHGPPGCGKTLVARALANECSKGGKKIAFFMRKGADCLSKWVGESERQLRLLFDQAYQFRPSIIFFDEIDGLAPIRSSRQDQIHSSIVSTLLALMDGLDSRGEVVVIGATNRIDAIDPALRRPGRFDREFIFPLPTREDRCCILSIHTRAWNPQLKPEFITELADNTVGYCGADLRSLCTEAALFALRRRYPQIYSSTERLVLDITKIQISSSDFHNALKAIVPTAQRSDSSVARALPAHLRCLFVPSMKSLLSLVCFVFSPSWKAVRDASKEADVWTKKLNSMLSSVNQRLEELRKLAPPNASQWSGGGLSNSMVNHVSGPGDSVVVDGARANRSFNDHAAKSKQKSYSRLPSKNNSLGSSGYSNDVYTSRGSPYSEMSVQQQDQTSQSIPRTVKQARAPKKLSFLDLHQRQQVRPSDLGRVFFDLTELSCEGDSSRGGQVQEGSIMDDCHDRGNRSHSDRRSASERRSTSCTPSWDMSRFLGAASHPHIPPTVHYPRLILCGQPGMGQSMYLAPALLHALEDFPVKIVDLLTVFGSSIRSSEEACTQILREATRVTPSILFLPRLDSWWNVTSEAFQVTLLSSLSSLPPSTPLLILGTAECMWQELPDKLKAVFGDAESHSFVAPTPDLSQRKQFFYDVLLDKPIQSPPSVPRLLSELPLEELPVASPPKPREFTKEEWAKYTRQREAVLRELRMFLRDATNKLLAERKFKEFGKPVKPEEVPDYHEIIIDPMDLGTMMKKIDEHCYTLPKQWIADIELIAKNALEYNPEHDSDSRLLRHRAGALQDMAHSFLDHELSEDFEKQCEEIEETYQKLAGIYKNVYLESQTTENLGLAADEQTISAAHLSINMKSDLYDAPRRSLRQLGLQPVEPGFPYYSPVRPRAFGKNKSEERGTYSDHQRGYEDRSMRSESIMSVDSSNRSGGSNSTRSMQTQNGMCNSSAAQKLTNVNVRRQIIRPWEDKLLDKMDEQMCSSKVQSDVEPCPDNYLSTNNFNRSVLCRGMNDSTSHRPQSRTSTPTRDVQSATTRDVQSPSSARPADSCFFEGRGMEAELVNGQLGGHQVAAGGVGDGNSVSGVRNCSAIVSRELESTCEQRVGSPQPHRQVVIDGGGLLELYERVVKGTEHCSVEKMEELYGTFEQLVFRHRMHWDKESLLGDLKLAANLFFQ